MNASRFLFLFVGSVVLCACSSAQTAPAMDDLPLVRLAQFAAVDDGEDLLADDDLKIAAIEALMSARPQRALPLLEKVLSGNASQSVKSRALFVLSQVDLPRAHELLAKFANESGGKLQREAIRSIGIGGSASALAQLAPVYRDGDDSVRESVLQAYLIADDADAVFALAVAAQDEDEFARISRTLGAMGATAHLKRLLDEARYDKGLVQAYAIAGDLQSLQQLATRTDDPRQRLEAIRSIGVVGGARAGAVLEDMYRQADDEETRDAALQGMLICDHDDGILALFQASNSTAEQRKLLRTLVTMDSEHAIAVIDAALGEGQ